MKKLDGRKINPTAMEEIRIRAVQQVQAGESPEKDIKTLGFARACIYNWLARYRNGGWQALKTGSRSGRPKKLGGSEIRWIYRVVRSDAVLGIFNDSDFIGGGTDGKGHELGIDFQVAKSVMAAATYFINDRKVTGDKEGFNRLQLDLNLKF